MRSFADFFMKGLNDVTANPFHFSTSESVTFTMNCILLYYWDST